MTPLWTAIIAGFFTLLGGCLTFFSSQKVHERQAKEARKTRKIAQLERLNKVLERVHQNAISIATAAVMTIHLKERQQVASIDDASLDEMTFLTRVYLTSAKLYCAEIRHIRMELARKLTEIYSGVQPELTEQEILQTLDRLQLELDDSVEHLRESLVAAARDIEES